MVCKLHLCY